LPIVLNRETTDCHIMDLAAFAKEHIILLCHSHDVILPISVDLRFSFKQGTELSTQYIIVKK